MSEHISSEGLHDLLDGQLPSAVAERARGHLEACGACREALDALASTLEALSTLPDEARAPEGLWGGIEGRLFGQDGAATADATVLPLASARWRRRFTLTVAQLAAAAGVVSLVSATVVWLALSGGAVVSAPEGVVGPGGTAAIQAVSTGVERYDEVVRELEAILQTGRGVLAPATLETLESSRQTIDAALEEVRRALEADPSNQVLTHLLIHHQKTKLRLLRQAAAAVQAMS